MLSRQSYKKKNNSKKTLTGNRRQSIATDYKFLKMWIGWCDSNTFRDVRNKRKSQPFRATFCYLQIDRKDAPPVSARRILRAKPWHCRYECPRGLRHTPSRPPKSGARHVAYGRVPLERDERPCRDCLTRGALRLPYGVAKRGRDALLPWYGGPKLSLTLSSPKFPLVFEVD